MLITTPIPSLLSMFRILEISRINIGYLMTRKFLRRSFRLTTLTKFSPRRNILQSLRSTKKKSFGIPSQSPNPSLNSTTSTKAKATEVTETIEAATTKRSTKAREITKKNPEETGTEIETDNAQENMSKEITTSPNKKMKEN